MPISAFVRFAIMTSAAVWSNWDTISGLFERHVEDATKPLWGYYSQHIFEMLDQTGTFSVKERGLYGVHWINTTGGDLDVTWTAADYAAVENAMATLWSANGAWISNGVRLVEHRWYGYGPGVLAPNPPSRVTTLGSPIVGTATGPWAHQVANTVTLRTALRRHWGRIYVPWGAPNISNRGQLGSGDPANFANAARTALITTPGAQGIVPVVYDRARKAVLGTTAVEVDSVPDIVRRRRPRQSLARTVLTS